MMKIVKAMKDSTFRMFYGDFKKICSDYKTNIRTYNTNFYREEDSRKVEKYSRILNSYKVCFKKNPWANVEAACAFEDEVDEEAKRRGIA